MLCVAIYITLKRRITITICCDAMVQHLHYRAAIPKAAKIVALICSFVINSSAEDRDALPICPGMPVYQLATPSVRATCANNVNTPTMDAKTFVCAVLSEFLRSLCARCCNTFARISGYMITVAVAFDITPTPNDSRTPCKHSTSRQRRLLYGSVFHEWSVCTLR